MESLTQEKIIKYENFEDGLEENTSINLRKIVKRNRIRVLSMRKFEINKNNKNRKNSTNIYQNKINDSSNNSILNSKCKIKKPYKIKKFEIKKSTLEFDSKTNYYVEYWKMFNENEYILAKIKENLYEINNMKCHLHELKTINKENK